jgi:TolA-binding protein
VTTRLTVSVAICALLVGVAALTGCATPRPTSVLSDDRPRIERPAAVQSDTPEPAGPVSEGDAADVTAIDEQLDAMQRELDSLRMPSDNDFQGAEGSVY